MASFRRICVFCGSSPGAHPAYREAATSMGRLLAEKGIGLVYGGGNVGLMGAVADAALAAGGEVIGVIPEHLEQHELAHQGLTDLRVVKTMHERKALMADLAEGFVALPGGLGTMEEFFEVATWTQLGIQSKPLGLLNLRGYYDLLIRFLEKAVEERFFRAEHRALIAVAEDPASLLAALQPLPPVQLDKWLDRSER